MIQCLFEVVLRPFSSLYNDVVAEESLTSVRLLSHLQRQSSMSKYAERGRVSSHCLVWSGWEAAAILGHYYTTPTQMWVSSEQSLGKVIVLAPNIRGPAGAGVTIVTGFRQSYIDPSSCIDPTTTTSMLHSETFLQQQTSRWILCCSVHSEQSTIALSNECSSYLDR